MTARIITGDCREAMAAMDENSVDAIVCDPPYGLSFMGKGWDHGIPGVEFWTAALRVAKPGAYLLAFGGTRTYHRLARAIEDAGWEIRDCVMWVYGSGFPKSHNGAWGGTALKPAWEPIIMARKSLIGTVAANVQQYGTGGLNIDGCRVPVDAMADASQLRTMQRGQRLDDTSGQEWGLSKNSGDTPQVIHAEGRWPANLIHDGSDEVVGCFPVTTSGTGAVKRASSKDQHGNAGAALGKESRPEGEEMICYGDTGSAARFFYCAKASRSERDTGMQDAPDTVLARSTQAIAEAVRGNTTGAGARAFSKARRVKNNHPTVKPIALMRYLCRLVTPPDGLVLDPFMGSGSTGVAALQEGFKFVGVDLSPEYVAIAEARIGAAQREQLEGIL